MVRGHRQGTRATILESVPLVYVGVYSGFLYRRIGHECIERRMPASDYI